MHIITNILFWRPHVGTKGLVWTCHKNPIKKLKLKWCLARQNSWWEQLMSLCSCNIHVHFRNLYTNQLVLFCHEFCQPNQHNICSTSLSSPSQLWKNHWMACHYPKSPNSAAKKKKWDCFLYKILINVSNIKHCIWPHDHMCISEYSARHFINNSPTISKSRLINLLWLNIIIIFNHSKFKFIDLDSSLEEQYGFLKGLNLFFGTKLNLLQDKLGRAQSSQPVCSKVFPGLMHPLFSKDCPVWRPAWLLLQRHQCLPRYRIQSYIN